ncbi:MAG: flagellar motor protein MotB [Planctomycetota bacterium]
MKRVEEEPKGAPEWVVTFGDMISLLVTFFVLLLTFSTLDDNELKPAFGAINTNFGNLTQDRNQHNVVKKYEQKPWLREMTGADRPPKYEVDETARIEEAMRRKEDPDAVPLELDRTEDGTSIRIDVDVLFEPGTAKIREDRVGRLLDLAEMLKESGRGFLVQGHADTRETWSGTDAAELAGERALAVAQLMMNRANIPASKVGIESFADHRPQSEETTIDGRRQNRRIEIFVLGSRKKE